MGGLKVGSLISPPVLQVVETSVLQVVETHCPCTTIFMIGNNDKVLESNTEELTSKIVATMSCFREMSCFCEMSCFPEIKGLVQWGEKH